MRRVLTGSLAFMLGFNLCAQDMQTEKAIVAEGKQLYYSEMASWYGTDVFVEKFKAQRQNAGGYFSYMENGSAHCVFFSRSEEPNIIAWITFDSTYQVQSAKVDGNERAFSPLERELYLIRKNALGIINSDTLFKTYDNITLNLIPMIYAGQKKVYVLSGPKKHGMVVLSNDYLLTFDKDNNLTGKKQLHRNIIPINYTEKGMEVIGTMHSHSPETGDYITPTDICTLMLYAKFAGWKHHYVISKSFVSIWDCEKNDLVLLTREAWEKIRNHQLQKAKN